MTALERQQLAKELRAVAAELQHFFSANTA